MGGQSGFISGRFIFMDQLFSGGLINHTDGYFKYIFGIGLGLTGPNIFHQFFHMRAVGPIALIGQRGGFHSFLTRLVTRQISILSIFLFAKKQYI